MLMQKRCNSIASAMELLLFCINLTICGMNMIVSLYIYICIMWYESGLDNIGVLSLWNGSLNMEFFNKQGAYNQEETVGGFLKQECAYNQEETGHLIVIHVTTYIMFLYGFTKWTDIAYCNWILSWYMLIIAETVAHARTFANQNIIWCTVWSEYCYIFCLVCSCLVLVMMSEALDRSPGMQ